jgi:diguanylate cyclase (GGDEF)-like protein
MTWHVTINKEKKPLKNQFFSILKIASIITVVVLSILLIIYTYEYRRQKNSLIQELVQQENAYLGIATLSVQQNIVKMANDLLTLADFTSSNIDIAQDSHVNAPLKNLFLHMSENYGIYDQIRYINEEGEEEIRVNYSQGEAQLVEEEQLRNKGDRYYFQDSYLLPKGGIYISPIDLNVEDGEIETPYKPVIRLATPVFDEDGQRHGIVILNYLAGNLLEIVDMVYKGYESELSLINQEGYFLINSSHKELEFGFMFEENEGMSLEEVNPVISQKLQENEGGWYQDDDYLYTYTRLYPFVDTWADHTTYTRDESSADSRYWVILTQIPMATIQNRLNATRNLSQIGFVVLIILIISSSILIAYLWHQKNLENDYIRNLAHYDQLTKCFNRAWGLRLLDDVITRAKSKKSSVGLLFLDLDKFKEVNDTYGHKAGDHILIHCAKVIKDVLREDDFVVRLGGDEFLIILPEIAEYEIATEMARTLNLRLKEPITFEFNQIFIDSSIGISVYPDDGHSLNELVSSSDAAMYKAKQRKRGSYVESRTLLPT